ncbi:glycosyltransferase family protein [Candidatus Hakubella thermalkaliphila]|uniref:hypothetical protein n=1 Tax=Candidatus Hakubella thermalkaliphila TaxID=2754717 RepID=UPI001592BE9E|nr:hypothetical protein [Candidatus Hakubella thermalkaliphila]
MRIRLFKAYPSNNYVAISENQRKAVPAGRVYRAYNAIAYQDFPFSPNKEDFFLWIGKIWPGKGLHSAIEVARRADLKLKIAGRPHPSHLEYFQNLMERVDGQRSNTWARCLMKRGSIYTKEPELCSFLSSGTNLLAWSW